MPEQMHEQLTVSLSKVETASYESLQLVDKAYAQWIISHILTGEVTTSCQGQTWQGHAGDIMVHPPHLPFSEISSQAGTHQWCSLDILLGSGLDLFRHYPLAPIVTLTPSAQFSQHFCALEQVWQKLETPFREVRIATLTLHLISLILESGQRSGCAPIFQTPPDRFSEVIQYITGHLDQKIIRQDLAALVHLHPSYFDRAFQRDYGVSPMQMVRHLRLRQSLHLLETTNLSLSTIAYACGLGDAGYLSRVFRQHYGQTPGHYRQSIQHSMTDYMPPEQRTAQTTGRAITRE